MDRIDVAILVILGKKNATTNTRGLTTKEILELSLSFDDVRSRIPIQELTLRVRMRNLEKNGLVKQGVKNIKTNTYYISELGISEIEGEN